MTSTKAKSRPNKNFFSKQRKHKHHLCKCCTNNCRAAGAAISIFVQTVAQTPVSHRRHCNINSRANSRANSLTNSRSAQSSRKINKHSTQTRRSTPLPRAHPSRHDSQHRSRAPTHPQNETLYNQMYNTIYHHYFPQSLLNKKFETHFSLFIFAYQPFSYQIVITSEPNPPP